MNRHKLLSKIFIYLSEKENRARHGLGKVFGIHCIKQSLQQSCRNPIIADIYIVFADIFM